MSDAASDDDVRDYYRLYMETASVPGSGPPSSEQFVQGYRRLRDEGKARIILARQDGELVAGSFFPCHAGFAAQLQTALSEKGRRLNAGSLLLWESMLAFKADGFKTLDLVSVEVAPPEGSREAGVREFKGKWGGVLLDTPSSTSPRRRLSRPGEGSRGKASCRLREARPKVTCRLRPLPARVAAAAAVAVRRPTGTRRRSFPFSAPNAAGIYLARNALWHGLRALRLADGRRSTGARLQRRLRGRRDCRGGAVAALLSGRPGPPARLRDMQSARHASDPRPADDSLLRLPAAARGADGLSAPATACC